MADKFGLPGFIVRYLISLALVMGTYNPSDHSFYHWIKNSMRGENAAFTPEIALVSVTVLIAWLVFVKATFDSLGMLGVILGGAFFACLVWLMVDRGLISTENNNVMIYIVEAVIAAVLALGLSWGLFRRRWAGQQIVDDVEGD